MQTLTEMLEEGMLDSNALQRLIIKGIVKEWLKTVGLPSYWGKHQGYAINRTDSIRRLLVTLVDEP